MKHATRMGGLWLAPALLLGGILAAPTARAADADSVSFTLEGCRNNGTITLPNGAGKFICPDSAYTSGNLGKGWSELDLVPYRLTASAGNSAPAGQTYTVALALDYEDAGKPGYDVLSAPVLNTALSSASCTPATVGSETHKVPGIGGIHDTIYRLITITQSKNTDCVYDYYGRLALGSHLFPGSSLHANLLNEALGTGGVGARDVSIPVKEIAPQTIAKTMEARQNANHTWTVSKSAEPGQVEFGDVCKADAPTSKDVTITVTWTKAAAVGGSIIATVNIYATNPAARIITVNLNDKIYKGNAQTDQLSSVNYGPFDVPGGTTSALLVTDTFTFDPTVVGLKLGDYLNDVATGTYTDKVTGIAIPGSTTATALAQIQAGNTTNSTATITDSESLTGDAGLAFSVPAPSLGSFSGYTAGSHTTGPVDWSATSQSGSNSVSFTKTVYLDGKRIVDGTLSDQASLEASDGFTADSNLLEVPISSDASVKLTVQKTIPAFLDTGEKAEISFKVTRLGDASYLNEFKLTFSGGGATTLSEVLTGLVPDTYSVEEVGTMFYAAGSSTGEPIVLTDLSGATKTKDLTVAVVNGEVIANCSGTVSFTNAFNPDVDYPLVKVQKITTPALLSSDPDYSWEFKLYGPTGTLLDTKSANAGAGYVFFGVDLTAEGTYRVVETTKSGWDLNGATPNDGTNTKECRFVVDFPEDRATTFACTFENTKRGQARVVKTVSGGPPGSSQSFTFQLRTGASAVAAGTIEETKVADSSNGGVFTFAKLLVPGSDYQLCEIVMPGWTSTLGDFVPNSFIPPDGVAANPNVDNSIVCVNFTVTAGATKSFAINNAPPPGGRALTIGFWKNWASCATSSGKQKPVLDQTLGSGFLVGDLLVDTCTEAVALLNKSTLDGKKKASDPAFNLAAQFVAAKLNVLAQAGTCPAALTALTQAQALLDLLNFNGYANYNKPTPAQATTLNSLATTLDRYNNNLLCSP